MPCRAGRAVVSDLLQDDVLVEINAVETVVRGVRKLTGDGQGMTKDLRDIEKEPACTCPD